ncbi:MAG: hypothetical protein M0Z79_12925 [Nitrospiraceae bacterium]|nr:hypothetical protein [Nitrospiraceae bacterium]
MNKIKKLSLANKIQALGLIVAIISVVVTATIGLLHSSSGVQQRAEVKNSQNTTIIQGNVVNVPSPTPMPPIGEIRVVNKQVTDSMEIEAFIRNPSNATISVSDIRLRCEDDKGHSFDMFSLNRSPSLMPTIIKPIEKTPLDIGPNKVKDLVLLFFMPGPKKDMACKYARLVWTGADGKEVLGDRISFPFQQNIVYFNNIQIRR